MDAQLSTVIYLRQSLDRTGEGVALARQEEDCRLLAQAKRWDVRRVFADNDTSATSGKKRPDFEAMLADVAAGRCSSVVVWHLDRLVRTMSDLMRIIEAGKSTGLNISCVHGVSLDLSDPTGVAVAQILTAVANMETGHKAVRQKRAALQRAEQGSIWWSRRPFGYNSDGTLHDVESHLVRRAYDDLLAGVSLGSIARRWNAAGVTSTSGNPWDHTTVRQILAAPRNAGLRVYKREIVGAGQWDAVVPEPTWRSAMATLNEPGRRINVTNRQHLLTGILRCGVCADGTTLRSSGRSDRTVYRCSQASHLSRDARWLEALVREAVLARLGEPDILELAIDAQHDDHAAIRRRRDEIRVDIAELGRAFAAHKIPIAQLTAANEAMERELGELEARLRDGTRAPMLSPLVDAADRAALWDSYDVERQRAVIAVLWDSITLLPRGRRRAQDSRGRIVWQHRDPSEVQFD